MLEPRVLFAVGTIDVPIGDGGARVVRFVDADGTTALVSVRGAAASVRFTGEGLGTTMEGRNTSVVTGTAVSLTTITATGGRRRGVLSVGTRGGDGRITVASIVGGEALKIIDAPAVTLTAELSAGLGLRKLSLLRTENAALALAGASAVAIAEVVDTDLSSSAPLGQVRAGGWGGPGGGGTLAAPSIKAVRIVSAFTGQIVAGAAGTLDLGAIVGSTIQLAGSLGRLRGNGVTDLRVSVGGSIGAVAFAYMSRAHVYAGVRSLPVESPIPAARSDFIAPSMIRRFHLGSAYSSGDSVVAAPVVGRVVLGDVHDDAPLETVIVGDRFHRVTAHVSMASKQIRRVHASGLEDETVDFGSVEVRAV